MPLKLEHPLAITMWDFSWLERRWPGAGYENWERALDELVERGYDAVRIDAYPHLMAAGPDEEYTIVPWWSEQDWGSPAKTRVVVRPNLIRFIRLCHDRQVKVALSTWYQHDEGEHRLAIPDPTTQGRQWARVLDAIAEEGLLDAILFVDLCNEWPNEGRARFFAPPEPATRDFTGDASCQWMQKAIATVREQYPQLDYCFSYDGPPLESKDFLDKIPGTFDLFEPHIWMVHANRGEFYRQIEYKYERFDPVGYENVVDRAEPLYRANPAYWQGLMLDLIERHAAWSELANLPLVTTECWGVVNYKDWPLLDWEWVKELCDVGTRAAAATGRWAAIATSNFCGPQFVGMWRDVTWHRTLTDLIHESPLPAEARR